MNSVTIRIVFVFQLVGLYVCSVGHCQLFPTPIQINSDAEEYVRARVNAGKLANLSYTFRKKEDRVIGADVVRLLIENVPATERLPFSRIAIDGAVISGALILSNIHTPYSLEFINCTFKNFVDAEGFSTDGVLIFQDCIFEAPTDFSKVSVKRRFDLSQSLFTSPFKMPSSSIGEDLIFTSTNFQGAYEDTDISNVTVGRDVLFDATQFKSPLLLDWMTVQGFITISNLKTLNPPLGISLKFARIYGGLLIHTTEMDRPLDVSYLICGGRVHLADVRLGIQKSGVVFYSAEVSEDIIFENVSIGGTLALDHSSIQGSVVLRNTTIGQLLGQYMLIRDVLELENVNIDRELNLNDMNCSKLHLNKLSWPAPLNNEFRTSLTGVTFEAIDSADAEATQDILKKLLADATFHASIYEQVEAYWRRAGYNDYADGVFIQRRLRETFTARSITSRVIGILDFIILGFGRKPQWTGVHLLIWWILGAGVFSKTRMSLPQNTNTYTAVFYSRWLYSLDALLPVLDLGMVRTWEPYKTSVRIYFVVHRIAGYLLVPIALLSITNLIR